MTRRIPVVLLLALLAGCGSEPAPDAVYREYLNLLARGDLESAYDLLASSTRDRLAAGERAWSAGRDHPLRPKETAPKLDGPAGFTLFRRLMAGPAFDGVPPVPLQPASAVNGASVEGNTARVTVRTEAGPVDVTLVREDGDWRIVLR